MAQITLSPATSTQVPVYPAWQSGRYYGPLARAGLNTSATLGVGTLRAMPFWLPNAVTFSRIGAEVTSGGDAGSTVRLGIYLDDGTGRPGALILDAGTIAGDSVAVQEIVISQAVTPGLVWLAAAVQGVTVTQPTVRVISSFPATEFAIDMGTSTPAANATGIFANTTSVTGALPTPYAPTGTSGQMARVFLKVA